MNSIPNIVDLNEISVKGSQVDAATRCRHYHGKNDIVAIRFKCCDTYYSCYRCHEELAKHASVAWSEEDHAQYAVLCGGCGNQLTIRQYLQSEHICPYCKRHFNPGCKKHYSFYFSL